MQVGFMRRFDPALFTAKEEVDRGSIREPLVFKAASRDAEGPPPEYARTSGGLFVDSSIHDIDLARWFMGSEVEKVYAEERALIYPEYKEFGDVDIAFTTLTFKNGSLGNIENSRRSGYGYDTRVEIVGSEGTLQVGYLRNRRFFLLNKSGVTHDVVPSWMERFTEAFVHELEHFAKSGILSAMLLTLITTMRVLDIIILLATPKTRTTTSIIFRYQTQGFIQHAYAIMLTIAIITLIGYFLLRRVGGRIEL